MPWKPAGHGLGAAAGLATDRSSDRSGFDPIHFLIALVGCLPQLGFDDCLSADAKIARYGVKLSKHLDGEIVVLPLDRSVYP